MSTRSTRSRTNAKRGLSDIAGHENDAPFPPPESTPTCTASKRPRMNTSPTSDSVAEIYKSNRPPQFSETPITDAAAEVGPAIDRSVIDTPVLETITTDPPVIQPPIVKPDPDSLEDVCRIVDDGDMLVEVFPKPASSSSAPAPTTPTRFLVASQILWAASPKIRSLSEVSSSMPYVYIVPVQTNAVNAVEIVLKILCYKHKELPQTVDGLELYMIAWVAKSWKVHEVISHFVKKWIDDALQVKPLRSVARWVFIAWVFQLEEEFRNMTERVTRSLKLHSLAEMSDIYPPALHEGLIVLQKTRMDILRDGFTSLRQKYGMGRSPEDRQRWEKLQNPEILSGIPSFCLLQSGICHYLHLGQLLEAHEKYLDADGPAWGASLYEISSSVKYHKVVKMAGAGHQECGWESTLKSLRREAMSSKHWLDLVDYPLDQPLEE